MRLWTVCITSSEVCRAWSPRPWCDLSDLSSRLADENQGTRTQPLRSHAVELGGCLTEEVLQRGELSGDYLRVGIRLNRGHGSAYPKQIQRWGLSEHPKDKTNVSLDRGDSFAILASCSGPRKVTGLGS